MQCAPTHTEYTNPHRQTGDVRANLQAPEVLNAVRIISCVLALCFDLGDVIFRKFLWESVQLSLNALPLPLRTTLILKNLIQMPSSPLHPANESAYPATPPAMLNIHTCS